MSVASVLGMNLTAPPQRLQIVNANCCLGLWVKHNLFKPGQGVKAYRGV